MTRARTAVAVVGLAVLSAGCGRSAVSQGAPVTRASVAAAPLHLVERLTGSLAAPLQDPSSASLGGGRVLLLGGLTAADASADSIIVATASGARSLGRLPSARHDTAAVRIGRFVYLFGGGNATSQLDDIVRVDPTSGRSSLIGHLPAPSSDSAAAAVGGTAYVVGGYTGTQWLDTIVAWRPGSAAHVVAHLPSALRYAAVTAVDGKLVIAGGSLENGTASNAVLEYVPATGSVLHLGRLPAPTTHAAAATIGGVAYVIGGRGAIVDSATARVVSVDVAARRVRSAGTLRAARSDLAAVAVGRRILLAGGREAGGTVATLSVLVPAAPHPRVPAVLQGATTTPVQSVNVYAQAGRQASELSSRSRVPPKPACLLSSNVEATGFGTPRSSTGSARLEAIAARL